MRMTTSVVLVVAACGSDGAHDSLTTPGSQITCEPAIGGPADFTGTFGLTWMCSGQGDFLDQPCEPNENPLVDERQIVIGAPMGVGGARAVAIGSTTMVADAQGPNALDLPPGMDGVQLRRDGDIFACDDGRFGLGISWNTIDGSTITAWGAEMTPGQVSWELR